MPLINEKLVIEKLKQGDNNAYKYVYDSHYLALCKVSYYFLKDKNLAESIVNDVIFHIWEIREQLEIKTSLRSYLLQAVRNRCLNHLSLLQNEKEIQFSSIERNGIQLQNIIPDTRQPLGSLLEKELEQEIQKAINELPPECRRIFIMSRFDEMSYEQISVETGISTNTVKYHIKNALSILRKRLEHYLYLILMFYTTLL